MDPEGNPSIKGLCVGRTCARTQQYTEAVKEAMITLDGWQSDFIVKNLELRQIARGEANEA